MTYEYGPLCMYIRPTKKYYNAVLPSVRGVHCVEVMLYILLALFLVPNVSTVWRFCCAYVLLVLFLVPNVSTVWRFCCTYVLLVLFLVPNVSTVWRFCYSYILLVLFLVPNVSTVWRKKCEGLRAERVEIFLPDWGGGGGGACAPT